MANGVIIAGNSYPLLHPLDNCPIPVFGPKDHGMEFKPGEGYNRERRVNITLGVIHWTGSENSVETMFSVLRKRSLGVEYCIDAYGSLYQFCDMVKVDTADAGAANKISWGVEVVNAGIRRAGEFWREPRYRKAKMGPRRGYDTVIHGKKIRCWDFYPAQFAAVCALTRLISDVVPTCSDKVCTVPGVIDWKNFNGTVGHYNLTQRKLDPGTAPMESLAEYMATGHLPLDLVS
jgi:N-acetyl-anhydromuramyl-L-alanine amidase AmpD